MELWETLQNPTTFYLLVFVSGNSAFAQLTPITYTYIQYTLVNLTNLMAGAQVIFTYLAVAGGIRIFQVGEGAKERGSKGVRKWERKRGWRSSSSYSHSHSALALARPLVHIFALTSALLPTPPPPH